jgi:hypothetical protein
MKSTFGKVIQIPDSVLNPVLPGKHAAYRAQSPVISTGISETANAVGDHYSAMLGYYSVLPLPAKNARRFFSNRWIHQAKCMSVMKKTFIHGGNLLNRQFCIF